MPHVRIGFKLSVSVYAGVHPEYFSELSCVLTALTAHYTSSVDRLEALKTLQVTVTHVKREWRYYMAYWFNLQVHRACWVAWGFIVMFLFWIWQRFLVACHHDFPTTWILRVYSVNEAFRTTPLRSSLSLGYKDHTLLNCIPKKDGVTNVRSCSHTLFSFLNEWMEHSIS